MNKSSVDCLNPYFIGLSTLIKVNFFYPCPEVDVSILILLDYLLLSEAQK